MFDGIEGQHVIAFAFAILAWTLLASGLPGQPLHTWSIAAFVGVCGGVFVHWAAKELGAGPYALHWAIVGFLVVTGALGNLGMRRNWNASKPWEKYLDR